MKRLVLAGTGLLAAAAVVLTGCSDDGQDNANGKPSIVTSTNVWASVASAVAGDHADVTALFTNSGGDPHEFEPSAADSAKVIDASVIVMNGGGYDEYMSKAASTSKGTVVDAFDTMEHDGSAPRSDAADHDHGEVNEHVFYNLAAVAQVATKIADALAAKDAANAAAYHANATQFDTEISGLESTVAQIKQAHNGTKVAQTEPLAAYLLSEAGLDDVAPAGFTAAVEQGQSPSAADRATLQDLLTSRTVKAFIYNTQAVDSVTEALLAVAERASVPVVKFTETLPDGVSGYIAWQQAQIGALASALNS